MSDDKTQTPWPSDAQVTRCANGYLMRVSCGYAGPSALLVFTSRKAMCRWLETHDVRQWAAEWANKAMTPQPFGRRRA